MPSPTFYPEAFSIASNARESESKFLSKLHHSMPLGHRVIDYFCGQLGFEGYSNPTRTILTYQFDRDNELLRHGITLRTRSTIDNRGRPTQIDLCIKVNNSNNNGLFLDRAEYETPIQGPLTNLDLDRLLFRYPARKNPELKDVMNKIMDVNPQLQFVMPVERTRHVLVVPNCYFDVYDAQKKAVVEINDDRPSYGFSVGNDSQPLLFAQDRELEFEQLEKPCEYDNDPRRHRFTSQGLMTSETQQMFAYLNDQILNFVFEPEDLSPNFKSKAHRGFEYRSEALERLSAMFATFDPHSLAPDNLSQHAAYLLGTDDTGVPRNLLN